MKKIISLAIILSILPLSLVRSQSANLISSQTGVSYGKLQKSLAGQNWQKANGETLQLMLEATQQQGIGWLTIRSLGEFPCDDLKIIDTLWKQASNGKFGFSVQMPIFIANGNKPGRLADDQAYARFGDQIGWRKDGEWIIFVGDLTYNLNAPPGHLPRPMQAYQLEGGRVEYTSLSKRIAECKLSE